MFATLKGNQEMTRSNASTLSGRSAGIGSAGSAAAANRPANSAHSTSSRPQGRYQAPQGLEQRPVGTARTLGSAPPARQAPGLPGGASTSGGGSRWVGRMAAQAANGANAQPALAQSVGSWSPPQAPAMLGGASTPQPHPGFVQKMSGPGSTPSNLGWANTESGRAVSALRSEFSGKTSHLLSTSEHRRLWSAQSKAVRQSRAATQLESRISALERTMDEFEASVRWVAASLSNHQA